MEIFMTILPFVPCGDYCYCSYRPLGFWLCKGST